VFWDGAFPDYSPDERRALYAELIRVLAALHRVDPERVGLGDFGRPGNYFARQISRWTRQYRAAETERIESMERLIEWLPANIPDDDATAIVHGDYRLDNLIFCADEPRIAAVLDWELSTLGHPLADVAYQCMLYHIDAPSHACLASTAGGDSGIPTEAEYIAAYCQRAGREGGVAAWPFYLAFALFRFASILQGVYRRGLDGNASSTTALSRGAQARGSADAAWALIY
jgi:aminoglycoside phosphotransferase (APT) family kinase protein